MALPIDIMYRIMQYIEFSSSKSQKSSHYTEINGTLVRISDHCTRLYVWDDMLKKNSKWRGKPIVSIVFDLYGNTYDEKDCRTLKKPRRKPIKVHEYVYNMHGDDKYLTSDDVTLIIKNMKKISGGTFEHDDKCQYHYLESINPPSPDKGASSQSTNESYLDSLIDRILTEQLQKLYAKQQRKLWR